MRFFLTAMIKGEGPIPVSAHATLAQAKAAAETQVPIEYRNDWVKIYKAKLEGGLVEVDHYQYGWWHAPLQLAALDESVV